jgi:hypothetical protein
MNNKFNKIVSAIFNNFHLILLYYFLKKTQQHLIWTRQQRTPRTQLQLKELEEEEEEEDSELEVVIEVEEVAEEEEEVQEEEEDSKTNGLHSPSLED